MILVGGAHGKLSQITTFCTDCTAFLDSVQI